jgi:threonine/homoserine/homoserine lactone efflux protein
VTGTTSDSIVTELLPLALIIALSPLSIIPGILILHTAHRRTNGPAFLVGWLLGLTALTVAFIGVSALFAGPGHAPPRWASWLRIAIGVALIAFGIVRWLGRHRRPHEIPGMRHIADARTGKALTIGALLTLVNPKVLFVCAAAGLAIGTAGLQTRGMALATVAFVGLAGCTVALPIVAYMVFGARLDPTLERLKAWMERNNAALVAGILVIIGLLLLYKGIHGL